MNIEDAVLKLREGEPETEVTLPLREFLEWFNATRRGAVVCEHIRLWLLREGLCTEPDFQSAYIGSEITLKRKVPFIEDSSNAEHINDSQGHTVEQAANNHGLHALSAAIKISAHATGSIKEITLTAPTGTAYGGNSIEQDDICAISIEVSEDPTYRIRKLAAANVEPFCVNPDMELKTAVAHMIRLDYTQLPVTTKIRDVRGVISWKSIGTRLATGKVGGKVCDFMDKIFCEVHQDSSIFQAIPMIVEHDYVLVRDSSKALVGIVTASDLSMQFLHLTEPFLLLGEIENHIRKMIRLKFNLSDLVDARHPDDVNRTVTSVANLSLGECKRFLENPVNWMKSGYEVDRPSFCKELGEIVRIRNEVMHFDPDGLDPSDLTLLRKFVGWIHRLVQIGII